MTLLMVVFLALLVPIEAATITVLLVPFTESAALDWILVTGGIAPALALSLMWLAGLAGRISADTLHVYHRITGKEPRP